jgi:protocatechuate 3,4-dioxygenase beta subunit
MVQSLLSGFAVLASIAVQQTVSSEAWERHERLLRGSVVTTAGDPVADAKVDLRARMPGSSVSLVPNQHLPDAYPRGLAWTDSEGNFEIGSFWPRAYHIVPKHRPVQPGGGWRDFAGEFPSHAERWPWTVDVPDADSVQVTLDLPPESKWDAVAPPSSK